MEKQSRVFIAGHRGFGRFSDTPGDDSAWFQPHHYASRSELDLLDQSATAAFFLREKPDVVVFGPPPG
ncbi:MAG: hypothetical protein CM1200mP41_29160 [Gammaproteobacteria bacterium]|nr:MAG: hypothetical protein CM1200mP41_29160 [Gammaproteobacteria bacterium]